MKRSKLTVIIAYAIAVLTSMFFIGPIMGLFIMSLKPPAIIALPTLVFVPTLRNYQNLFFRYSPQAGMIPTNFIPSVVNSTIISSITTLTVIFFGSLTSYAFSRFRFRGRFALGLYIFVCYSVPAIAFVTPMYFLLALLGELDTYVGLILVHTTLGLPWTLWILKSFFDSVPKDIEEQGMIDGCSRFSAFARIVLPISAPGLVIASIFTFLSVWNSFLPMIILSGSRTKPFIVFLLENSGWGTLSAASIVSIIPACIVALLIQRYVLRGLSFGAVKQ